MRIVSIEDFRDIYIKACQRGIPFLLSKLSLSSDQRTKSSFNQTDIPVAYWSQIPLVRKRWNVMITGDEEMEFEEYTSRRLSLTQPGVKMLSVGSGVCSHELRFAALNPNWEITCIDFSEKLLQEAAQNARENGLSNIRFVAENIYRYELPDNAYDIVFFNASLHHFKNMGTFLERMRKTLKPSGYLVINEFVGANRMLYDKTQMAAINEGLQRLDKSYRTIYRTSLTKNRYYGSGLLRMLISDPSECVESERILPEIHRLFTTVEEKGYGGNILMPLLKDLSHHFMSCGPREEETLRGLFALEDEYLQHHTSDYLFGIYTKS